MYCDAILSFLSSSNRLIETEVVDICSVVLKKIRKAVMFKMGNLKMEKIPQIVAFKLCFFPKQKTIDIIWI